MKKLTNIILLLSLLYLTFQAGRAYHRQEVQTRIFTEWGEGDEGTELEGYINRGIPFPYDDATEEWTREQ